VTRKTHVPSGADDALHMVREHLAEVRPAEVEDAAEVAEGHQDADRGVGGDGDVDAAVHALEDGDRGRVLGEIAFACQPGFRDCERSRGGGEIEQPVDTHGLAWMSMARPPEQNQPAMPDALPPDRFSVEYP
jgi:hypothetical protein